MAKTNKLIADSIVCTDTNEHHNPCGNPGVALHECPYQKEINHNRVLCTCCRDCEDHCFGDI